MDHTIFKWNDLHAQDRFKPRYPSEIVVQYVFQNFPRNQNLSILDFGAGGGRHSFFMAQEGYNTYASDVSSTGIEHIQNVSLNMGLAIQTQVHSSTQLDFSDEMFDGLISFGVIYYLLKKEIEAIFKEIYRVLKSGGRALIVVRSTDDHRFGQGQKIEENTFIIDEKDESKSSFYENGMKMHFFSQNELIELTSKFTKVTIDRIEQTLEDGKYLESNFIVKVIK